MKLRILREEVTSSWKEQIGGREVERVKTINVPDVLQFSEDDGVTWQDVLVVHEFTAVNLHTGKVVKK